MSNLNVRAAQHPEDSLVGEQGRIGKMSSVLEMSLWIWLMATKSLAWPLQPMLQMKYMSDSFDMSTEILNLYNILTYGFPSLPNTTPLGSDFGVVSSSRLFSTCPASFGIASKGCGGTPVTFITEQAKSDRIGYGVSVIGIVNITPSSAFVNNLGCSSPCLGREASTTRPFPLTSSPIFASTNILPFRSEYHVDASHPHAS